MTQNYVIYSGFGLKSRATHVALLLISGRFGFRKPDQSPAKKEPLDDLQFLQFGFGHYAVDPSALVIVFLEHVIQFADVTL